MEMPAPGTPRAAFAPGMLQESRIVPVFVLPAVIRGQHLPAEWAESSDPYVVVEYGHKHHKTKCDEGKRQLPRCSQHSLRLSSLNAHQRV